MLSKHDVCRGLRLLVGWTLQLVVDRHQMCLVTWRGRGSNFDVGGQEYRYNSIDVRPRGLRSKVSGHAHPPLRDRPSPLIDWLLIDACGTHAPSSGHRYEVSHNVRDDCNLLVRYCRKIISCHHMSHVGQVQFGCFTSIFTVRRSYANAVLRVVILSVRPFVRLSVTRMLCDKTYISMRYRYFYTIPKGNHLDFLIPTWLVADAHHFRLKFALKVTYPRSKNADFDRFPLITSQP